LQKEHIATGSRILKEKWQIYWLHFLSSTQERIFSHVLKALHGICKEMRWHTPKRLIKAVHLHLESNKQRVLAIKTHGAALISFSRNCPHLQASDIYLEPAIKLSDIQDPKVRELGFAEDPQVKFFHKKGECRGMCFWFAYLYFSCQGNFSSAYEHVLAVAKQFEEGASAPAILLQSLWIIEDPLLGLEGTRKKVPFEKFKKEGASFASKPVGFYSVGVGNHRINYIKISEEEAFIFDPNYGTWHIPCNQALKAHHYICSLTEKAYEHTCSAAKELGRPVPGHFIEIAHCTGLAKESIP
jgi:hypothetical protein